MLCLAPSMTLSSMTFQRKEFETCCGVRRMPGLMEMERNLRIGGGLFFLGAGPETVGVSTRGGDS
jgi:hypothetical protein